MLDRLRRLHPFQTPDAQRLAVLFAIVYFAQGMWYLPNQTITIVLKERGFSAGDVATFFSITTIPWLIKPIYGLISDFLPLCGRRRKSYLFLTSALAAIAGAALATGHHSYARLAIFFTIMGLGLAFTDVLVDALMVENGRPRGLTGAFQSVQWAAIYAANVLVGLLGGYLAERRDLHTAFAIASCFPLISFFMTGFFVTEPPTPIDRHALRRSWGSFVAMLRASDAVVVAGLIVGALWWRRRFAPAAPWVDVVVIAAVPLAYVLFWVGTRGQRELRIVAGFIFFFTFSPSFGPALIYYQTDQLGFSQQFIGLLGALAAIAATVGAAIYAPLSRRVPLQRLIILAIAIAVVGTLAYLLYRDWTSALIIDILFGCVGMITQLAFLDLAAKACPRGVEATFFALLMSVFNGGVQISQIAGGYLYDWLGFTPLVFISAAFTALAWLLVPLVKIDRIDAKARAEGAVVTAPA